MKSDQEIMKSIRAAIDDCTKGIGEAPSLQYQIARKAKGEETVTKKLSATAIVVIALIVVSMTAALAAALNSWGIIDFAGRHANTYVPPNYEESLTPEHVTLETGSVRCSIEESLFDGKILRITARVIPKTDVLLLVAGSAVNDPVSDLFWHQLGPDDYDTEWETIGSYALREHAGHLAEVILSADVQYTDCTEDFIMNSDGSYTVYLEYQFEKAQTEIELPLTLHYFPMTITEELLAENRMSFDRSNSETTSVTKEFHSVKTKEFAYETPMEFPSVGVRVVRVTMTVTPLEIRYALDYEITDMDAWQTQEGGLWFEFIDPSSSEAEYPDQRLSDGLTSSGSVERIDSLYDLPDEIGTLYRQTGAIGLNALSGQYTLRAFNAWEKTRYETVTFKVSDE